MKTTVGEFIEWLGQFNKASILELEHSGCGQDIQYENAYISIDGVVSLADDEDLPDD